jgi:hypothetical protein
MWATISYPEAPTMIAQPLPALASGDPSAWDQALYAFLIEKGNRSDRTPSSTTVRARIACLSSFYRFGSWLCLQQSSRPNHRVGKSCVGSWSNRSS